MQDFPKMWQTALVEIETAVSQANFSTWFKETSILKEEGGVVYLGVPNSFTQEWLEMKFHKAIFNVLKNLDSKVTEIRYVIIKDGVIISNELRPYIPDRLDHLKQEIIGIIKESRDEILAAINK